MCSHGEKQSEASAVRGERRLYLMPILVCNSMHLSSQVCSSGVLLPERTAITRPTEPGEDDDDALDTSVLWSPKLIESLQPSPASIGLDSILQGLPIGALNA